MPFQGEFAKQRAVRRINQDERIRDLLSKRMKVRDTSDYQPDVPLIRIALRDIPRGFWEPALLLAVDGSHAPVAVENGYPGAEVGYVTAAAVLLNVKLLRELDQHRPVDPRQFREIENVASVDAVMPGCNVILDDAESPMLSLRQTLYEKLAEYRVSPDSETLLETYEVLLDYRQSHANLKCPYGDDCLHPQALFTPGLGLYQCGCTAARPMFSTDALRIHEGMVPDRSNVEMYGEIRQMLEHLLVLNFLRWMEKTKKLWILRTTAIIVDGPLAFFGYPSTLLRGYLGELRRLNEAAKACNQGQDILVLGVEKTGVFVTHFEHLDQTKDGSSGAFTRQTVGLLTDQYIKANVIFSKSERPWGKETYFGRKFFYKTSSGARIVGTLPMLYEVAKGASAGTLAAYPRLGDALALLDQIVSNRYPNSIYPLISANAEASIPMNLGARALEELTHQLLRKSR